MKTIIISIFLFLTIKGFSQTTDVLYVPSQKSLIVTYNNYSSIGFYVGGYVVTQVSNSYIYTTPLSILNRAGLNLTYKNRFSLMGGASIKNTQDSIHLKPDIWVKINPMRIIFKTEKGFDFSLGLNYSDKLRYGVGLSLNFW